MLLCTRCFKHPVKYKARQLCAGCYVTLYRRGEIERAKPTTSCSNPRCEGSKFPKFVKGLCWSCYYRGKKNGTLEYRDKSPKSCSIEGCKNLVVAKGLCDTHRKRIDRHDDVEAGRPEWWGDKRAKRDRENARLRALPPREKKDRGLRKKYKGKFRIDDYDRLFAEQGGVCKICKQPEKVIDKKTGLPRALAIDHDPETNEVRGLLCGDHNVMLGLAGESADMLEIGAAYIRMKGQI